MNGLQNFSTGQTATPNTNATPSQINSGLNSLQGQGFIPVTTVPATSVGSTQPFQVPPSTPSTAQASLGAAVNPQPVDSEENDRNSANDALMSLTGSFNEGQDEINQDNQNGIPGLQSNVDNLNAQALSTKKNYDDQITSIQSGSTGATVGGAQAQVDALTRQRDSDLANIAIQQSVATGDLTRMQDIVTKQVAADTDAVQSKIDALKTYISNIDADPEEKAQMTAQANAQQANLESVKTAQATVLANAAQNGAPSYVLSAISKAAQNPNSTAADIYSAAGKYASDPKTTMDVAVAASTVAKNYADIANEQLDPAVLQSVQNGLQTFNGVPYYTSDTLAGVSESTKNPLTKALIISGAKSLSTTEASTLNSIQTALSDTNTLSTQLNLLLPTSASGQPTQEAKVQWGKFLDTNPQLSTFMQQWQTDVMPLVGALGNGKGGSSRLFPTIQNMLPQPTDTVDAAQAKIAALTNALQTGGNTILGIPNETKSGKPFNYGAALKAGYTDAQIRAFIQSN